MDAYRKAVIIVGLLFLATTAASMLYESIAPAASNDEVGLLGSYLDVALASAAACLPLVLRPLLTKYRLSLALGYVGAALAVRYWGTGLFAPLVFSTGSLLFYYMLHKQRLLPRWLSGWGIIGSTLFVASAFLPLFGYGSHSTPFLLMHAVGGINQIVIAVWLLFKGCVLTRA